MNDDVIDIEEIPIPANVGYSRCEAILQTYSLEQILELNDKTEVDVLYYLITHDFMHLPEPLPVDFIEDDES